MRAAGLILGIVLIAGSARAQDDAQAESTLNRAEAAAEHLEAHAACVRAHQRNLTDALALMREARGQMRTGATAALRQDAARAVESLGQRVNRILVELRSCPPAIEGGPQAVDEHGAPIVRRDPPPDPTADAVARPNPATRVVERDTRLTSTIRVQVGEQVDGFGRVDPAALRSAMGSIASRLDQCYGQLLDRRALTRGTATLGFKVTATGRVTQTSVIQTTLGDGAFRQCLSRAVSTLRVSQPARGGDAEYSYTLAFGGGGT